MPKENLRHCPREKKNSFDGKDSVGKESPDGRPIVNVDEERRMVEEARNREFKFREGGELARRIREATNHGTGVSVGWKEGLAGR